MLKGTKAHHAAGKIHSGMQRGFIRAEAVEYEPRFGKLMKNKREIWSLKGLRIDRHFYLLQTCCPCVERQEWGSIRSHLQPQSSPRGRKDRKGLIIYLKLSPALCPHSVLCCYLKSFAFNNDPRSDL
ncbi:MAG: DUF933 domain-containing protein [Candidatus Latescibacteria bacterium]|nr:DUF933 domain-containing protein [Candidatus Latescibacterota bacterium]